MRDYMDCPCCGSRLVVVGQDLLTLEDAQDEEMDSRIERDLRQGGHSRMGIQRDLRAQEQRWGLGEEEPDGA